MLEEYFSDEISLQWLNARKYNKIGKERRILHETSFFCQMVGGHRSNDMNRKINWIYNIYQYSCSFYSLLFGFLVVLVSPCF